MAGAFDWSLLKIPHDESDSNMSSARSLSSASHDGLTDGEWAQEAEVASAVEETNRSTNAATSQGPKKGTRVTEGCEAEQAKQETQTKQKQVTRVPYCPPVTPRV
jgi:hypothetical protein